MIYADASPGGHGLCLGDTRDDEAFCGQYTVRDPISDHYNSIWAFILDAADDEAKIHHESCRNGLARHLGYKNWDELTEAAEKRGYD